MRTKRAERDSGACAAPVGAERGGGGVVKGSSRGDSYGLYLLRGPGS